MHSILIFFVFYVVSFKAKFGEVGVYESDSFFKVGSGG